MKPDRAIAATSLFLCLLLAVGCAYPISSPLRQQARRDLTFNRVFENPDPYRGTVVIWGGVIRKVENQKDGSNLVVLAFPLTWREEPKVWEDPDGRFIVKSAKYLDPAVYCTGRRITVAGEVTGSQTRPLNEVPYRYPELTAREIHLWRSHPVHYFTYYGYGYGPYWYGPAPAYGGYYYGPNFAPLYEPYGWWFNVPFYGYDHGGEWNDHDGGHGHEGGGHGGEHWQGPGGGGGGGSHGHGSQQGR